jgi:hypothetical protein
VAVVGVQDNSFDLVWACESGEHMPDKKRYVEVRHTPQAIHAGRIRWGADRCRVVVSRRW